MALDCDMTVFNCQYALAPEHKAGAGARDIYACLRYVIENAQELNIDASRIAVFGTSGGGTIMEGLSVILA